MAFMPVKNNGSGLAEGLAEYIVGFKAVFGALTALGALATVGMSAALGAV